MRWYQKPKPLDYRHLPRSETASVICLIQDDKLSSGVLFVYNTADKDQPDNGGSLSLGPSESKRKYGKPAGGGLPTGGVEEQYIENPGGTATRETEAETGLVLERVEHLFTDEGIIISDKRTGAKIKRIPYTKGKQKSVKILFKTQKALDNPIHVFRGKITNWPASNLRAFFLAESEHLIETSQATAQEIADTGIYVMGLSSDDYDFLGIEERKEVSGIALISTNALLHMWSSGNSHFAKDFFVYPSHIDRAIRGLIQIGILEKVSAS